jgi:integrase
VFALRQRLAAAMADNRLVLNPAENVPLPSEQLRLPRFLSQAEVDRLADSMPDRYHALVLVGAYAGLRWGEAAGLLGAMLTCFGQGFVVSTADEVRGHITLGQEPKTQRSRRTVPVARSVMRQLEAHLAEFVDPDPEALVFTAPHGGPLRRSLFSRRVWRRAVKRPGCRASRSTASGTASSRSWSRQVATCGKCRSGPVTTNVAFTLTPYGGLFEDGSEEAVSRLDALLGGPAEPRERVLPLKRGERF